MPFTSKADRTNKTCSSVISSALSVLASRRRSIGLRLLFVGAFGMTAAVPMYANQLAVTVTGAEKNAGTIWDAGTVTVVVNQQTETFSYGQFSTNASVASGIAAKFSQDCSSSIQAQANGSVITFAEKQPNGTDIQLYASVEWNSATFAQASFEILLPNGSSQGNPSPLAVSLYLSCTPNPIPSGATAQCAANLPANLAVEPTGTIAFSLDGAAWSSATVDNQGLAVATDLTGVAVGTHTVTATYSGDSNYLSTSDTLSPLTALNSNILPSSTVYSYAILSYLPNSDVQSYADSVNGDWMLAYDNLDRLASTLQGPYNASMLSTPANFGCWNYDSFGNLQQSYFSPVAFGSSPGQPCPTPAGVSRTDMSYNASNQITSGGWRDKQGNFSPPVGTPTYDAAGNMTNDLHNEYLYDANGQICAMQQGVGGPMIGYLYNPEGARVAKGALSSMSCDPTVNGFTVTSQYVIGPDGSAMTEVDGSGNWVRTNVADIATYKNDGLGVHFQLADWLGTRRVQTDYLGQVETTCSNQPFGDGQVCTNEAGDAADEHFTGQKRDNETGNDYFGARYYVSAMGRFLSPDYSDGPDLIPHADLGNPQSFNLYAYVGNNPLNAFDPDGHDDCSTELDFSGLNCDEANALPPLPPPPPPPPPPGGGSGSIAGSGSDTFLGPTPTASFGPNQKSPFAGFQLAGFQSRAQQQNTSSTTTTQGTDYVSVSYWPKGAGGFGHIGIGVNTDNTQGYSTADSKVPWYKRIFGAPAGATEFDLPAHTKNGEVAPHSYMHIAISADQAAEMRSAMAAGNGGHYNLFFNNCAQFVESVLHAGGVSGIPHGEVFGPAILGAAIWYGNTWR